MTIAPEETPTPATNSELKPKNGKKAATAPQAAETSANAPADPPAPPDDLAARKKAVASLVKDVQHIPFQRIELSLDNMRDSLEGIEELAKAIDEQGLLENLVVWEKPEPGGILLANGGTVYERYILVAGFRRHAALSLIRQRQPEAHQFVTCRIKRGNETDMIFAQLQENVQRSDFTPAELSKAMVLLENRGLNRSTIAKRLGKHPSYVTTVLKWREAASDALRDAVSAGDVSFAAALEIAKLPEAEQAPEVDRLKQEVVSAGKGKKTPQGAAKRSRERVAAATGQLVPLGRPELRAWRDKLAPTNDGKVQEPAKDTTEYLVWRTILGILGEKAFPARDYPRPPKGE